MIHYGVWGRCCAKVSSQAIQAALSWSSQTPSFANPPRSRPEIKVAWGFME